MTTKQKVNELLDIYDMELTDFHLLREDIKTFKKEGCEVEAFCYETKQRLVLENTIKLKKLILELVEELEK